MIKKLLLILLFCSVATLCYAADIDVGPSAESRGGALSDFTMVNKENSANATGTLDHLEVYISFADGGDIVDFASFIDEGSNVLSTNGVIQGLTVTSGLNIYDAPGHFVAFAISTGEYLGTYSDATVDRDTSGGSGMWYTASVDSIPASSVTFSSIDNWTISSYAEGTIAVTAIPQVVINITRRVLCIGERS